MVTARVSTDAIHGRPSSLARPTTLLHDSPAYGHLTDGHLVEAVDIGTTVSSAVQETTELRPKWRRYLDIKPVSCISDLAFFFSPIFKF